MLRNGIAALVAALLMAAPVTAQSHQHGSDAAGTSPMKCAMHEAGADHGADAAHGYAPEMLLKHASGLKLTDAQTVQLQALQALHHEHCETNMAAVRAAEAAATALLQADSPDMTRYEGLLREAADRKVDCRLDMVSTGQAAKSLLTAVQREHVTHMSHAGH